MVTPDAAWAAILGFVEPLESVTAGLGEALGHCLAETVKADRDLPPTDRSAMDGYAVRSDDLKTAPRTLRLSGEVAAGSPARPRLRPGCCIRVYTGACIPPGADAVAIQEQTEERQEGLVLFRAPVVAGANILRRGEDARKGEVLLHPGQRISAAETGILAAVGKASVRIYRKPRVKILCTGSELLDVSAKPRPHEIRNSVGPAIAAALCDWGFDRPGYQTVPDDPSAILNALRRALRTSDAVLLTGGVSVGRYDYVPEAIRSAGGAIRFHGVAMKPGKPTLFATIEGRKLIFGLPGNPLSALNAFHEFVLPALRRLSGRPSEACRIAYQVPLAEAVERRPGRQRHHLARLVNTPDGLRAAVAGSRSSADLASAAGVDGAVLVPSGRGPLPAGAAVAFRPWRPLP